jgi:hypothetical protein
MSVKGLPTKPDQAMRDCIKLALGLPPRVRQTVKRQCTVD